MHLVFSNVVNIFFICNMLYCPLFNRYLQTCIWCNSWTLKLQCWNQILIVSELSYWNGKIVYGFLYHTTSVRSQSKIRVWISLRTSTTFEIIKNNTIYYICCLYNSKYNYYHLWHFREHITRLLVDNIILSWINS